MHRVFRHFLFKVHPASVRSFSTMLQSETTLTTKLYCHATVQCPTRSPSNAAGRSWRDPAGLAGSFASKGRECSARHCGPLGQALRKGHAVRSSPATSCGTAVANNETKEAPGTGTWIVVGTIFAAILVALYAPLVIELSHRASA